MSVYDRAWKRGIGETPSAIADAVVALCTSSVDGLVCSDGCLPGPDLGTFGQQNVVPDT